MDDIFLEIKGFINNNFSSLFNFPSSHISFNISEMIFTFLEILFFRWNNL